VRTNNASQRTHDFKTNKPAYTFKDFEKLYYSSSDIEKIQNGSYCKVTMYNGEPLLPVSIGGRIFMALIDTGCNQSIISLRVFKQLTRQNYDNLEMKPGRLMAATMANGQKMDFIEGIKLKFQTCKSDICLKTFVCPTIGYEVVLGTDFLLQNRLNIDFEKGKLKRVVNSTVTVSRFAKIPTNSAITLYTRIPAHATEGDSIFEPHPKWIERGLLIPKQLVNIDKSKPVIPIKITNCTEELVYILKDKTLGKLTPLNYNEKPLGPLSDSSDDKMPKINEQHDLWTQNKETIEN
jgi:predicted aspartyl protease